MSRDFLFTSESVTEGHPDKMADQVSDAVVDAVLRQDPAPRHARVAVNTLLKTGLCLLAGEVRTRAHVDVAAIARRTILRIGYDSSDKGFDARTCGVLVAIEGQSEDIARGVDAPPDHPSSPPAGARVLGAGDQGLMFGYACDETPSLMPLPITLAHALARRLAEARRTSLPWLWPDGKSQVTVRYEEGRPVAVHTVVVSAQHAPERTPAEIGEAVRAEVIARAIPAELIRPDTKVVINPTGRFVTGGPLGDTGLTGRKIVVDTYGGMGRHGGGAFSGKDPSKVDRSGGYLARWIAKNVVAAGLARRCEVQIAYVIGHEEPVSLLVEGFGTEAVPCARIEAAVRRVFPLRPADIIDALALLEPRYEELAAYGHCGREGVPWEHTDRAAALASGV